MNKRDLKGRMNIPTTGLMNLSGDLSIHQLGALRTVTLTKKIMLTQKPTYLFKRLHLAQDRGTRAGNTLSMEKISLGMVREGFVYRGTKIFNLLPNNLKQEQNFKNFKKNVKSWIKEKIPVKP